MITFMNPLRSRGSRFLILRHCFGMAFLLGLITVLRVPFAGAEAQSDIVNTKHNLSVSGPGPVRATIESRICVFCHTPHNSTPLTPLWNKELRPEIYNVYTSPSLQAGPLPQPTGPTKLCLSCHDGTIAMGAVVNPSGGITMAGGGTLPPGSLSDFGLDLSGHHPVSFSYMNALPNVELASTPPADLVFTGTDELHCDTCHDPHSSVNEKFLAKDNRYSVLCTTCHQITGWSTSLHATSTASVTGILPRPPKTWPTYAQLDEWGCETCHTPHFAPTAEQLLNFTALPPDPFSCTSAGCHSSDPGPPHRPGLVPGASSRPTSTGMADIAGQIRKASAHHDRFGEVSSLKATRSRSLPGSVACSDCHNPHVINQRPAAAPFVSGMLDGVSGIDVNGAEVESARYEYEVCFKCHSDHTTDFAFIPRVIDSTNTRLAFDSSNPSYHPVVDLGRGLNVPSVPSSLAPSMKSTDLIYCSSCHADDDSVSNGPHGSNFAPILRERYETADNTSENFDNYALCYRCHDRSSILRDDSFKKKMERTTVTGGGHSGHLSNGAPCSACHDPHGVAASRASVQGTGAHTHLINFDTRIVYPTPGNAYPIYEDTGAFSGTCTLECHGKLHDHLSYP